MRSSGESLGSKSSTPVLGLLHLTGKHTAPFHPKCRTSPLYHEASPNHHVQQALALTPLTSWKLSPWNVESCSWILFSRCISNVKAISSSRILENSALVPTFQNAEKAEPTGSSKRRVMEECFTKEDNKKCRIDVASPGEGHAFRTQETGQAQGGLQGKPLESTGTKISRQQDLVALLGRKWLLFQSFRTS